KQLPEKERYQTVYASEEGSAAAPTAGLHFTNLLLDEIRDMGVTIEFITLHVGLGTFRPVSVNKIEDHKMHAEFYQMSQETADTLASDIDAGGRTLAASTTATRTPETIVRVTPATFVKSTGRTDICIYPPIALHASDGLTTTAPLPKWTRTMMLISSSGRES